jgi:hypothetical protein
VPFPTVVFQENGGVFTRNSTEHQRAPQHITDPDVWGVSDPAGRARGPHLQCGGGVAHAPFLFPLLCWGAHRAAQSAARN